LPSNLKQAKITTIAALEEGVIDDATKVECKGSINYGKRRFGCWKKSGHGFISIHRALVESCDIFFYEAGKRLGIDKMAAYAFKFGFGKKTGVPIANEEKGLVPDTKWKMETKKTKWFLGETVINAIGQGYLSATPIQAAVMMSAVSNGGIIYRPIILRNSDPIQVSTADVKPETLEIIRDSLKGVVHEQHGTGRASRSAISTIGGKT
jgi:penicillin-binding protein 2